MTAMTGSPVGPLLAVHIATGVLSAPWCAGGFLVAGLLAIVGGWRIRDEEVPRIALLTAAFFVATLLHAPAGPTTVHLLLTGLLGVVLGRRVALAIPLGLFLQAALFQHGGFDSLGVNSCVMVLPALGAWQLFGLLRRLPGVRRPAFRSTLVFLAVFSWVLCLLASVGLLWASFSAEDRSSAFAAASWLALQPLSLIAAAVAGLGAAWLERRLENTPEFPVGLLVGELAVLATVGLNCAALTWGGVEDWHTLALGLLVAHLPIALIEGVVLGFTVGLLARVKPEILGWRAELSLPPPHSDPPPPGEREKEPPPQGREKESPQTEPVQAPAMSKSLRAFLFVSFGLLAAAQPAHAHTLEVECELLAGNKVLVSSRYLARPRSFPAQQAQVHVYGPDKQIVAQGRTNNNGEFIFHYAKKEPLTVEVYQEGHRQTVTLFSEVAPSAAQGTTAPKVYSSREQHDQPWLRDSLIGIGFVLALAAFVLSVRNARRLRALEGNAKR
jgi:cobalt/nickel transport system permease protein